MSPLPSQDRRAADLEEALAAYAAAYPCPGFLVGHNYDVSGCRGPLHGGNDCPTCAVVSESAGGQS